MEETQDLCYSRDLTSSGSFPGDKQSGLIKPTNVAASNCLVSIAPFKGCKLAPENGKRGENATSSGSFTEYYATM